jgi:hypothetical protein
MSTNRQSDCTNLSPVHLKDHQRKLAEIVSLKDHLKLTATTFAKYADAGGQLAKAMTKLSYSFNAFPEFKSDATFNRIPLLLEELVDVFNRHADMVRGNIIHQLDSFIDSIKQIEEDAKHAQHDFDAYMKLLDQYVANQIAPAPKKGKPGPDLGTKLQQLYWTAVKSDFHLTVALERISAKKLFEIAVIFVSFVNMASATYLECQDSCAASRDALTALLNAMGSTDTYDAFYKRKREQGMKSLEQFFRLWVIRFDQKFTGTSKREHEGILWKKGTGVMKSWAQRYFVLTENALSYHHGIDDCDQKEGELSLLCTTVKPLPTTGCFTIISPTKSYTLRAMTDYDRDEWISVIQNNIEYLLNHSPETAPRKVTDAKDAWTPLTSPENGRCADCGAGNPSWCCINWGICICIHCCGVHRSLTTSVSKPRSLTLDRLDSCTQRIFEVLGNAKANQILEENVGEARITAQVTKADREAFIRRKYVQRDFVAPMDIDVFQAVRNCDYLTVFRAICTGKLADDRDGYTALHCAASSGDPTMALLVALNMPSTDVLNQGWSPLTYAAFYGHRTVARALIDAGCVAVAADQIHPYEVALSKQNEEMSLMFFPFWHGQIQPGKVFEPPVPYPGETP